MYNLSILFHSFVMQKQTTEQMNAQTQDTAILKNRKSDKLTSEELAKLKLLVGSYPTKESAAIHIGVGNRNTLGDIMAKGSGSPEYIARIRTRLGTCLVSALA